MDHKCPKCSSTLIVRDTISPTFKDGRCPMCRWTGVIKVLSGETNLDPGPKAEKSKPKYEKFRVRVTGVENRQSYNGGRFYHIFFKADDGRSYLTHAYPRWNNMPIRNFARWQKVIDLFRAGKEVILEDLIIKKSNIIDADSMFKYVKEI